MELPSLPQTAIMLLLSTGIPYASGYFARTNLKLKREGYIEISAVTATDFLIFLSFQSAISIYNFDYPVMLGFTIPVLFAGYLLARHLYDSGCRKADANRTLEDELSKQIAERYFKPVLQSYTEHIDEGLSEYAKRMDSFEQRINTMNKSIYDLYVKVDNLEFHQKHLDGKISTIGERIDQIFATGKQGEETNDAGDNASDSQVVYSLRDMRAKGREARDTGEEIQAQATDVIIEQWKGQGRVESSFEKGRPDVILYDNENRVYEVIAIKSYTLDVTTEKGMRNTKGQKVAVTFHASRDARAEVEFAKKHNLSRIRLVAFNIRNGRVIFNGYVGLDDRVTLRDEGRTLEDTKKPNDEEHGKG